MSDTARLTHAAPAAAEAHGGRTRGRGAAGIAPRDTVPRRLAAGRDPDAARAQSDPMDDGGL
jgi:hypothetical protein